MIPQFARACQCVLCSPVWCEDSCPLATCSICFCLCSSVVFVSTVLFCYICVLCCITFCLVPCQLCCQCFSSIDKYLLLMLFVWSNPHAIALRYISDELCTMTLLILNKRTVVFFKQSCMWAEGVRGVCEIRSKCEVGVWGVCMWCCDEHVAADQRDSPLYLLPTSMSFKHLPEWVTIKGGSSLPPPYWSVQRLNRSKPQIREQLIWASFLLTSQEGNHSGEQHRMK